MGRVSDISEYYLPVLTPNWMNLWGCHSDMVPWLSTDTEYCEDPKFVDPDNGDYRLAPSPCIDAGLWNLAGETKDEVRARRDLAGSPRFVRSQIDMGCYEAQNPACTMILLR